MTILLATSIFSSAQDIQLAQIAEHLYTNRISADFDCNISTNEGDFSVRAEILVQGDCYFAKSSGFRIFCNGNTRWTVDDSNKEVYIDKAYGLAELEEFVSSVHNLNIRKVNYLPLSDDLSAFVFDTKKLGKDWLITDLRQE